MLWIEQSLLIIMDFFVFYIVLSGRKKGRSNFWEKFKN
nr:MAG TPA: hypothetical protein [Caudoviricetes sp.]